MERLAARPIRDLRRREILSIRDAIAKYRGPGAANGFIITTSSFLAWAHEREWIDANPAFRIARLAMGEWKPWKKEDVAEALSSVSAPLKRVVYLGMFTGQRRGDLCAMKWSDIKQGTIQIVQQKTGMALRIPIHPALADAMKDWPRTAETILTDPLGKKWIPETLTSLMWRAAQAGQIPQGLNVHGLRKLAATLLAEAGCSVHEIAAITGHKTLQMVQHYTKSVDQMRMATSAINRVETSFLNPKETNE